jgi:GT2 family glycosyltransferase
VLRRSTTELVAFIDARLIPEDRDWLAEMAGLFVNPRCAAVGARIVCANELVEQCGLLLGVREESLSFPVARAMRGASVRDPGYFGWADIARRTSAVAGGVLIVSREAAEKLGGFDETVAEACAVDLDFSLRARDRGSILLTCPHAVFVAERAGQWFSDPDSVRQLYQRWEHALSSDPYHSPNLANVDGGFELAFPPRVRLPWRSM